MAFIHLVSVYPISRKTGYKILDRYRDIGLHGLSDRSRGGAPKIRERLRRLFPDIHTPAISTVHAVLDRHGLVKSRTRRRSAIRTDNGVPFASPNALYNPGKLSVWWLRLGIAIERIKPGNPQQNGRRERMHLTLKIETTKPAAATFFAQQAKFDDFIECFNTERPYQALGMRPPAEIYRPSPHPYRGLPDLSDPFHDKQVTVTSCGRICFKTRKINLSQVFAGPRESLAPCRRSQTVR